MTLKETFVKFGYWRLITIAIALLAIPFITLRQDYASVDNQFNPWHILNMWTNFDGKHYKDLAEYGYGVFPHTDKDFAFFPVYPGVIRAINILFQNSTVSGLVVSNLAFILAIYYLFKLLKLDFSNKLSNLTIALLLFFPTSFFFGAYYTESIFLLITVLSFYSARKGNFFLACIFALIASATRVTGIFLWPALMVEFYLFHGKEIKKLINPDAVWFLLPPLGLLSYMKFQLFKTGDALYFINSQPAFGVSRTVDKIILIHQVIFRYLKMLIFVDHTSPLFFAVLLEFISGVGTIGLIVYGIRKLRPSYLVYVTLAFILPTFTGTFLSMPRFVLVLFPLFAIIATLLEKAPKNVIKAYFITSAILSVIAIALFTRGYFLG